MLCIMSETFNTRHTKTGVLQRLTRDQIRPFASVLEVVADDAKPYEPGLFKPGTVGEFQNPEPAPQSVEDAQAAYDAVLVDHGPRTKVALEAKAVLDAAIEQAEADRLAAESAAQDAEDEAQRLAETAAQGDAEPGAAATSEGDLQ